MTTFVGKLTHSPRFSRESVPRWSQPLCFAVAGLPRSQGEFVLARLSRVATSVGAELRRGCSRRDANFYVVFTPNPEETLKYLHHHPWLLFPSNTPPPQIERFLSPPTSDVVRVWHNAQFVSGGGAPVVTTSCAPGDGPSGPLANCQPEASRLILSAVQDFTQALVVIDSTRLTGINFGQISAYVAFVGLVDFDLPDNLGDTPSILRLFTDSPEKRPDGLTAWDRAFLSALYNTDQRSPTQRGQIVSKMVDEIAR